jgi:hypothetical protein
MNDTDVINAFVAYLRQRGHPGLQVDRWPDKENRDSTDIDAIAGGFAIEHTSIDTLPNQRRDSDWFMQVVGGIEEELPGRPPFRLRITLDYEAVTKGQNWAAVRETLKTWIINGALRLADGRHVLDSIPGVPFRLHVAKASNRSPGVFFGRFEPSDSTLPDRIWEHINRKAKKLAKYHSATKVTVLLVENDDIALMDELTMLDAMRKAFPGGPPAGIDEIWYADTSIPSEIEFCDFTSDLRSEPRPTMRST